MEDIFKFMIGGSAPEPEPEVVYKRERINPFAFINAVSHEKKDIIRQADDPDFYESEYNAWITNKTLSYFKTSCLYANEMNMYSFLPKIMQYDYYMRSINKEKRFTKQVKKEITNDIKAVASYFNYSFRRAEYTMKFLTPEQIEEIKQKVDPGGTK